MRTLVVFCDTGALRTDGMLEAELGETEIGRYVRGTANKKKRTERLSTYHVARGALRIAGLTLLDIIHGEHGEPIPKISAADTVSDDCDLSEIPMEYRCFSASHSGNITAVAFSEAPVGIDVEGEISASRACAIDKRFLSGRGIENVGRAGISAEVLIARLDATGELIVTDRMEFDSTDELNTDCERKLDEKHLKKSEFVNQNLQITRIDPCSDVTAKWCTLEAMIKSLGFGFADFLNTGYISSRSDAMAYRIKLGNETVYMALTLLH